MKILEIRFININNLKGGPHVVSFNKLPLENAGIFAITGPTGSGKSTLLDVITLALFNQIPRFNRSISKNEMLSLGSVITHHTDSASASITYEINGLEYTSNWRVSTARTGNLKDYEMDLMDADGNIFDLKKSEVPAKNEEIIGLKYDQFIKSIILSQGEFAKFLKADKNERGQLLENITGTSIYRKIGQQAYATFKSIENKVKFEKELIGTIQILSPEERKEIQTEVDAFIKRKGDLDKSITLLQKSKQVKTDLLNTAQNTELKKKEFEILQNKIVKFESQLLKLRLHEKVSPLQKDLTHYTDAQNNLKETRNNLENYQKDLNLAKAALDQVIEDMGKLTHQKVDQSNFKTIMSTFEKEVNSMDAELNNFKVKGKELRERVNKKVVDTSLTPLIKMKPFDGLQHLNEQKELTIIHLREAGVDEKSKVAEIRERLKAEHQLIHNLQDLAHSTEHVLDVTKKYDLEKLNIEQANIALKRLNPLQKKVNELIESLKKEERLLMKRKEDAIKIAKLEDLRSSLTSGDPCPLCGSKDHPFSKHMEVEEGSEIEVQISKNKSKIEKEEHQLINISQEIIQCTTAQSISTKQIIEFESQLKIAKEKKKLTKQKIPIDKIPDDAHLRIKIEELISDNKLLEKALDSLETSQILNELIEVFQELEKLGIAYSLLKAKRREAFDEENVTAECDRLQDIFNECLTSQKEMIKAIEIESKDLKRAEKILQNSSSKLNPKLSEIGINSIEELSDQLLDEKELRHIKQTQETFIRSKSSIDTEIQNLKNNFEKLTREDINKELGLDIIATDLVSKETERDEINTQIGALSSKITRDNEDQAKIKTKKQRLSILNKDLEKWSFMNRMIGDATGNVFANFAQGLTLQNLIVYTNKRLQNLSDRYLLDKPADDGILKVIDLYQGNIERSVSTLSGGETFLISLALALSLSDMASKNVPLDSLFIDEGFGTLDQETLDMAMDTLERLQTESQKTVGVISHVEALKERINVQIRLNKNSQGYSKIEIVS